MFIEAIVWKWPGIQLTIKGDQTYENIEVHELNEIPLPSKVKITAAVKEYETYLTNEALNIKKVEKISLLRDIEIDKTIVDKIIAVNNAIDQAGIDAV